MRRERVLTARALNRALLARQFLLARPRLPLTRVLERVAGVQTQYAPSGYIGLWSRHDNLSREALTRALEARRVVQATLMRSTIHMVSARDFWPFAAALRQGRREWWHRAHRRPDVDMDAVAAGVRDELRDGPIRAAKLRRALEERGFPSVAWPGVGLWVDLIRAPPSGTWAQRRADLYELADRWLDPSHVSEAQGLAHLATSYLRAFGPASLNDFASWAGLSAATLRPVVERLSLRTFRDERGETLLDVPRAPLPDADTRAPVRFLPTWDATLLVHARRTQILPEGYRPLVFDVKTPHSVPTFLVDGAVAGRWRYEAGAVRLEPFEPIPARLRRELDDEADRLSAFHSQ